MCGWLLSPVSASTPSRSHHPSLSVTIAFLLLFIATTCIDSRTSQALEWESENVDKTINFGEMSDRSLRIDNSGNLHLIYGTNRLRYSRNDGDHWNHHVIDSSPTAGWYGSITVDESGNPHISYYDYAENNLKYAWWDGQSWNKQVVACEGDVGTFTSIALDSSGLPHISYYDKTRQELRLASWDGAGWSIEIVVSVEMAEPYTSLIIDSLESFHIAYIDAGDEELKYAHYAGSSWVVESVDSIGDYGRYCSMALDGLGCPHISYRGLQAIKHAYRANETWHDEIVQDDVNSYGYTSLCIDSEGLPHIAYEADGACYAVWDGSSWVTEVIRSESSSRIPGLYASLDLDADGIPHVSWIEVSFDEWYDELYIQHAVRSTSGWQTETVTGQWSIGRNASLALDSSGFPHVTYFGIGLQYAAWNGTEWEMSVVTTDRDASAGTALAIDSFGNPHLSYRYNDNLMYARYTEGEWIFEAVAHDVGSIISMDVDDTAHPHISCERSGNQVYLYHDGDSWWSQIVEEQGSSGALVLDTQGSPHIAYMGANGNLRYAWSDGSAWIAETVTVEGCAYIDLSLDNSDCPHVSYGSGGCLWYATRDYEGWHREPVSEPEDDYHCSQGRNTSIDVDGAGQPRITHTEHCGYSDDEYSDQTLFAYKTAEGWSFQPVGTTSGNVAVDEWGQVHLMLYHASGDIYWGTLEHKSTTGLEAERSGTQPVALALGPISPCPCRMPSIALIPLELSDDAAVALSVIDLLGRRVKSIFSGRLRSGNHELHWNGIDNHGNRVPSGTYIVSAVAGGQRVSKKVVLLR